MNLKRENSSLENNGDSEHLLCVWHYSTKLAYIKSSQQSDREGILLFYFTNEEHREFEDLSKAIQIITCRAGI